MTTETKQKSILLIITGVLFLANIITLVMLFSQKQNGREPGSRKSKMTLYLKKDLGFSDTQMAAFDSLHKKHMENVELNFTDMRREKENRFKFLTELEFSDSIINIAANNMAEKQKALEVKMLHHLKDVRSLATPAQRVKFDSTFLQFMNRGREKKKKD